MGESYHVKLELTRTSCELPRMLIIPCVGNSGMELPMQQSTFRTWHLALLPEHHVLVLNPSDAILSEVNSDPCTIVAQELFYPQELDLLGALLDAYPHYASYTTLYATIHHTPIWQTNEIIRMAQSAFEIDRTMHPIRVQLSRMRSKLRTFDLDVCPYKDVGYQITISSELPSA